MSLPDLLTPALYAAFVWWFATGLILWLDRLPRATFVWSFGAATLAAVAAIVGVAQSAADATPLSAFLAFSCAIVLWGWHEMSFLMGFIAGPRTTNCPPDARGWRRFKLAAATLIHHEIALAATVAALYAATWGQPNMFAAHTFALLWAMRLSAKFNLFLGARHLGEELLPVHLAHLRSYFRRRPMNALFPFSMIGGAFAAFVIAGAAFAAEATLFEQAGHALMLALLTLALVEHAFLFLPPPTTLLWGWAAPRAAKSFAEKSVAAKSFPPRTRTPRAPSPHA
ncbi:MAG: DUF3623 family protein [Alphaproteobacteria bacterium]|nr:DUF3623 family protein [Alphaproteobacteria bacterium]